VSARGPLAPYLDLRSQIAAQRLGDGGPDVCQALSGCMDACLTHLAEPFAGERFAVVAVGGYGRAELCLYSDIDLMLLHAGDLPRGAIEAILYPLWDAALKVGHAVRSVREALTAASATLATLTALMDARTVAGDGALACDLRDGLGSRLRRGRIAFREPLAAAERGRRAREPYQLLEADVKDGRGGLRSLQSVRWEWRRRELISEGSPAPLTRGLQEARAALLATRNAIHSAAGRPFERYAFELRHPAAAWLGLDTMVAGRRLYAAMRTVDTLAASCWSLPPDPIAPPSGRRPNVRRLFLRHGDGQSGLPHAPAAGRTNSALVLAVRALDRSPDDPRLRTEEESVIRLGGSSEWDNADREAFFRLLAAGRKGWTLFQALEALGWVGRVLPEWRHVVAAPQEAAFHLHPVDVHLWRTAIELLAISGPESDEPWCAEVAAELGSLHETLLAALFHDIGKGWPGDHSATGAGAAAVLLRRSRFGPATTARVSTVIRHHLLLANTAMRRDIDDPAVIRQVADRAGDLRTLRMLYLLSIADARATGPSVWNPWKATLLRSLFAHVADELERRSGSIGAPPAYDELLDAIEAASGRRFDRRFVAEHLEAMPQGYADAFSVPELVRHLAAMTPPPGSVDAALDVRSGGSATNVVVVAEDRPGLLAMISGVFALNNVSVLDGRFYTRADGLALDVFHVEDALGQVIDARRWQRVREELPAVLRGELVLEPLLREKARAYRRSPPAGRAEVVVDAGTSESFSIVEVHCGDRVGLLHQITRCLYELGVDISLAKVETRGPQVVDTFYVRTAGSGLALQPAQLRDLAQTLEARLSEAL
jgi:[protein-PII] uridylyltransferase